MLRYPTLGNRGHERLTPILAEINETTMIIRIIVSARGTEITHHASFNSARVLKFCVLVVLYYLMSDA